MYTQWELAPSTSHSLAHSLHMQMRVRADRGNPLRISNGAIVSCIGSSEAHKVVSRTRQSSGGDKSGQYEMPANMESSAMVMFQTI